MLTPIFDFFSLQNNGLSKLLWFTYYLFCHILYISLKCTKIDRSYMIKRGNAHKEIKHIKYLLYSAASPLKTVFLVPVLLMAAEVVM